MATEKILQSASDFDSSPSGLAQRWQVEIEAAKKEVKKYHQDAKKLIERFLDKGAGAGRGDETRINLFSANVQVQRAMLFGQTPKVDVTRRYEDPRDAVARVAALILERILNNNIEDGGDGYVRALSQTVDDYLVVGMGAVRLRYEADFEDQPQVPAQTGPCSCVQAAGQPLPNCGCGGTGETELAPAYQPPPLKTHEAVAIDYFHWRDILWSPARTRGEVRWVAYRVFMSQEDMTARFGADKAALIPLNARRSRSRADGDETMKNDPWARGEVWEIWSRDDKKVYWYAEGSPTILDEREDPHELPDFFPGPLPLMANLTNDSLMPRPDFLLAQDLYNEIDYVSTRITMLERAVKVVGVYDQSSPEIRRILSEGFDNDLIPAANWDLFAQRGGIKGTVDWLPLDQVVAAMDKLREYRAELAKLLYEVTGMSDLLRGEQNPNETATASALKAKFASVRMKARQEEIAMFATEILRIKAHILLKNYDDQKILTESNIQNTPDAQIAQQAIQLLRSEAAKFRIEVKSESLARTDFEELKQERMAFLQTFGVLMQSVTPLLQQAPQAAPFVLEMVKWGLTSHRGSAGIEGVLDQFIAQTQAMLAQPKPPPGMDPSIMAKHQADMAKAQAEMQLTKVKAGTEIQTAMAKHQIDKAKLGLETQKLQLQGAKQNMDMRNTMMQERIKAAADALRTNVPGENI